MVQGILLWRRSLFTEQLFAREVGAHDGRMDGVRCVLPARPCNERRIPATLSVRSNISQAVAYLSLHVAVIPCLSW